MQGQVTIKCTMCGQRLATTVPFDTGLNAHELGWRIQRVLLNHRTLCKAYAHERNTLFKEG